jgi:hypothetical protein
MIEPTMLFLHTTAMYWSTEYYRVSPCQAESNISQNDSILSISSFNNPCVCVAGDAPPGMAYTHIHGSSSSARFSNATVAEEAILVHG